jgi:predicted DNA-binding protein (MmcQ/YjbR family)
MKNRNLILEYILSLKNVRGGKLNKDENVFYVNQEPFVILNLNKNPEKISIRCDKELIKLLVQKYDEVMPGTRLNPNQWITIIKTGQLSEIEIKDLIFSGYNQAIKTLGH